MSVINTNITSMIGQQNLQKSQNALQTSMERLSSGLRINSAKDDAAGQAIANRFTAQITGLNQAQRNANDGISIAQTAEGSLNQINDNLQRIRELSVQAANGTNSSEDLTSIQDEINQRLDEINRISEETDFNGTRVLAEDTGLRIQVGANDNQVINVGLRQINAQTLGLDGFNVDGSGATQNRTATVTDLIAAGGNNAIDGNDNTYDVTVSYDDAELSDVLGQLSNGDTVTIDGTAYTFDAASGGFTFENEVTDLTAASGLAGELTPNTGTKSGQYEFSNGSVVNFEVSSTGNLTIGGEAAYLTAAGELTTNDATGSATQATLEDLLTDDSGDGSNAFVTIDGTRYTLAADGSSVTFSDTASVSDVLAAADGEAASVSLTSGLASATIQFDANGDITSGDAYIDRDGNITTVEGFTARFSVNPESGEVTVLGATEGASYDAANNGFVDTDFALEAGAVATINSAGYLTTAETSPGDRTENPLAALDAALSQVDSLRSELGAVQNRFEDAITNLQTNTTNLSAARSRIEDADYAMEVANMTRAQILQQAGTSVLAQANQLPQSVLSLLG